MTLDQQILQKLIVRVRVDDYVRILPREHASAPLGMGFGKTRFSSPRDKFKVLYLAQDVKTALAETIIRDRFEGKSERLLLHEEFDRYSIASVRNSRPLLLLDLRYEGASLLGVSTDAVRAKAQTAGRRFSQKLYDHTNLDGIVYMSRITNKQCLAVYDRAVETSLNAESSAANLPELACLPSVIEELHITIIERHGNSTDRGLPRKMRGKPFTRPTIIAANEILAQEIRTHTQLNKVILRLGLEDEVPVPRMPIGGRSLRQKPPTTPHGPIPWPSVMDWRSAMTAALDHDADVHGFLTRTDTSGKLGRLKLRSPPRASIPLHRARSWHSGSLPCRAHPT